MATRSCTASTSASNGMTAFDQTGVMATRDMPKCSPWLHLEGTRVAQATEARSALRHGFVRADHKVWRGYLRHGRSGGCSALSVDDERAELLVAFVNERYGFVLSEVDAQTEVRIASTMWPR